MATRAKAGETLIERTRAQSLARHRQLLGDLVATIRRRMLSVAEGFYDIGEALREIVDKKLYAVAGHANLGVFLASERIMSRRQATKLIALARRVAREDALALGQERAIALLAYVDATPEDDTVAELVHAGVEIAGKPVTEASVREIEAAAREVRKRVASAKNPRVARARARADAGLIKDVRASLRASGVGRAKVTITREGVRIELTRAAAQKLKAERP